MSARALRAVGAPTNAKVVQEHVVFDQVRFPFWQVLSVKIEAENPIHLVILVDIRLVWENLKIRKRDAARIICHSCIREETIVLEHVSFDLHNSAVYCDKRCVRAYELVVLD